MPVRVISGARLVCAIVVILVFTTPAMHAMAQEQDAAVTPTLNEGDVISFDNLDKIRPYLPKDFWSNRDFFFYEGMQLEIGPATYDYSAATHSRR